MIRSCPEKFHNFVIQSDVVTDKETFHLQNCIIVGKLSETAQNSCLKKSIFVCPQGYQETSLKWQNLHGIMHEVGIAPQFTRTLNSPSYFTRNIFIVSVHCFSG